VTQHINLVLPALRPRFDLLALPVVVAAAVLAAVSVAALSGLAMTQLARLQQEASRVDAQLTVEQANSQALKLRLAARKGDDTLGHAIEATQSELSQRREVLAFLAQSRERAASVPNYAGMMGGFARHTLDGLWLVGFAFGADGVDIQGRALEPALLPAYIDGLNGDTAFAGKRFAALDMKAVDPAVDTHEGASGSGLGPRPRMRYVDFHLHAMTTRRQEPAP